MGSCNSTTNCNPCGPDFNAINQLATQTAVYARQANTSATNAENSFLEFNALYLGAFASAPAVDNEGNPIQVGALYWNSVSNEMFVWNGTAWLPDAFNEFTPFLATGTPFARNLVTRAADVVNVKDFGAVGDGVADDTAAIQSAITYATSIDNCCLYFPKNKYKITSNLFLQNANNFFIKGDGQGVTNLVFNNNSGWVVELSGFSQLNNFAICNLTLSANQQGGTALSISSVNVIESSILFQDIEISSFSGVHQTNPLTYWKNGLDVNNLRFCTFNNISIWGGEGASIGSFHTNKAISIQSQNAQFNFIFNNIKIKSCTYGIYGNGYIEGIYATNGEIWVCDYPLYMDASSTSQMSTFRFNNFHLNASKTGATFINVSDILLQSCNIVRSIPLAINTPTIYMDDVSNVIIDGSTIWSGNAATSLILINDAEQVIITSNSIGGGAQGDIQNYVKLQNTKKYIVNGNVINGKLGFSDNGINTDSNCGFGIIGLNEYNTLITNVIDNAPNKSNPIFFNDSIAVSNTNGETSVRIFGSLPTITFNPDGTSPQNCNIDFRSSGLSGYDSRIIATLGSGTSVAGNGTLFINTGVLWLNGTGVNISSNTFRPSQDNAYSLGAPSFKWANIYAQTSTIGTSDLKQKQEISELSGAEKNVAAKLKNLICKFKFNEAVQKKGAEKARWHFGIIAQEVKEAFESEGLDVEKYGLFCYDEFEEQKEIKNDNGDILQKYQEAGNVYGIRYEELLAFIISSL